MHYKCRTCGTTPLHLGVRIFSLQSHMHHVGERTCRTISSHPHHIASTYLTCRTSGTGASISSLHTLSLSNTQIRRNICWSTWIRRDIFSSTRIRRDICATLTSTSAPFYRPNLRPNGAAFHQWRRDFDFCSRWPHRIGWGIIHCLTWSMREMWKSESPEVCERSEETLRRGSWQLWWHNLHRRQLSYPPIHLHFLTSRLILKPCLPTSQLALEVCLVIYRSPRLLGCLR